MTPDNENMVEVSFDSDGAIRLLDSEKFNKSKQLQYECGKLSEEVIRFDKMIHNFISNLDSRAQVVDNLRDYGIGISISVNSECIGRERKKKKLLQEITDMESFLQGLETQVVSMQNIEKEQLRLIKRLSNDGSLITNE